MIEADVQIAGTGPKLGMSFKPKPSILIVSLVMHVLGLALPLAMLQIYDRILPSQGYGTAVFLVVGVALAIVMEALLRFGRHAMFASIGAKYEAHATLAALERLQHGDIGAIERQGTPTVTEAMRAIGRVRDFWSGQAGAAIYELPFVVIYIVLIAYIGGWLAAIPFLLFLMALTLVAVWNPETRRLSSLSEHASRRRDGFAWSVFGSLVYLKAVGAESSVVACWRGISARSMALNAGLEARLGWVRENAMAISQLSTLFVVAFGASEVMDGKLTTGALAACTMLAGRSMGPVMASLGYWAQLPRIREAQAQVASLMALPNAPVFQNLATANAPAFGKGEVCIDAPDLFDTPVTLVPGEVVHLETNDRIAASMLLSAIAGLNTEASIRIRVDNRDIGDYSQEEYGRNVMLVTQQLAIVPGSILQNLTLYDAKYNQRAEALSDAIGLQSHINRLKNGLRTEVGPSYAEQFDEGIAQRMAIVRALVRRPRVLLLDHAAIGVDLDGVKKLAAILRGMQGHTTVLIVTYKEPLISACNRSLKMRSRGELQ